MKELKGERGMGGGGGGGGGIKEESTENSRTGKNSKSRT